MTVYDYINLKSSIDTEFSTLQNQTEDSIAAALRMDDSATTVLDDQLNDQMIKGFDVLFAEYNRTRGNPAAMNLSLVQGELGSGYDIYIINQSGVIVYTTYPPEQGEDFRSIPYFYSYLTTVRQSQGFFPDRVVRDIADGRFMKYAYEPTPDHQYIMELGYSPSDLNTTYLRLDDMSNIARSVSFNPFIVNYQVFDTLGRTTEDNILPDNTTEADIKQVIALQTTLQTMNPVNHTETRYLFVNLKNPRYGSDMSRIVELTYDTGRVQDELNHLLFVHLVFGCCALVIGCLLAYIFSRRMTRPIENIAHDADIIAGGNFEHRIGTTDAREFVTLEKSINTMVDSLKSAIQRLDDEEIFHRDLIDQLPVGIFLKKSETGTYVFWNRASEEIFERPAKEVIGKRDEEIFTPAMAEQIRKEDSDALASRVEIRYKKITSKTRGERVIHMIIVPIYDSKRSVRYMLGIAEDVTDEAVTIKRDLIFSITRSDILDQLAVIMTYLERAQLKTTHEEMQMFFDKTIGSVESIKNQIAYERALQNPGVIAPRWQSVNQAFAEAIQMLPEHEVDITTGVGDLEIFADPLLPRIFFSLLSLSFRHGGAALSTIRMTTHQSHDSLILVYEDDSGGIPAGEKERIFEFGYSEDNMVSLFLIRELLGFTGIAIAETGEPGQGVRFEIVVPKGRYRNKK
ncbi:PAS domain-containing protein [Methanoregula sp.]|uniref:PAS domain-containing protein n=1 Tax=Methanoregula sp. TaxID=2052170 RepID=UPI002B8D1C92|nr:PAS domain-containing protein [Methanoregula sp.]HVP96340.1 PAS domain-containing protein [Methanoregula sp.]